MSEPHPDQTLPEDLPHPDQGLPLPPDTETPVEPPVVDNTLPETSEQVGDLSFYQRKTLGINWDPSLLSDTQVGIFVIEDAGPYKVRTVDNSGASSVTFPSDFTGTRTFRVAGEGDYLEGTIEIT
jgi:hypothetical protein